MNSKVFKVINLLTLILMLSDDKSGLDFRVRLAKRTTNETHDYPLKTVL